MNAFNPSDHITGLDLQTFERLEEMPTLTEMQEELSTELLNKAFIAYQTTQRNRMCLINTLESHNKDSQDDLRESFKQY